MVLVLCMIWFLYSFTLGPAFCLLCLVTLGPCALLCYIMSILYVLVQLCSCSVRLEYSVELLVYYILATRCTMATHGRLSDFDGANEDWESYVERLEMYFTANDVEDPVKQRAIFLSACCRHVPDGQKPAGTKETDGS